MNKSEITIIALPIEKVENMGYDLPTLKYMDMSDMAALANEMEIRSESDRESDGDEPKAFLTNLADFENDLNADDDFITSLTGYYVFYFTD